MIIGYIRRGYIGILEKKMETTIGFRVFQRMEKKMETIILGSTRTTIGIHSFVRS